VSDPLFPDDDATQALVIVCTDAGQHGSTELARIVRNPDGTLVPSPVVQGSKGKPKGWHETPFGRRELAAHPELYADMQKAATPVRTETGWRFRCPRCGRDVPFSDDTFAKAAAVLALIDVSLIDVSRMR